MTRWIDLLSAPRGPIANLRGFLNVLLCLDCASRSVVRPAGRERGATPPKRSSHAVFLCFLDYPRCRQDAMVWTHGDLGSRLSRNRWALRANFMLLYLAQGDDKAMRMFCRPRCVLLSMPPVLELAQAASMPFDRPVVVGR